MKRQIYYLLPDVVHTRDLYKDLKQMHVPENDIHVVMKDKVEIAEINDVHSMNEKDRDYFVEWFLWRLNLAIFGIALMTVIAMLIWSMTFYILIPLVVIAITFLMGLYFALRVPNIHWNEFLSALRHGEVLMIIDVSNSELRHIDHAIHRQHPEAINGGVCWKV